VNLAVPEAIQITAKYTNLHPSTAKFTKTYCFEIRNSHSEFTRF
jgi:hypothetical protein